MGSALPDESTIRSYLLGRLDSNSNLVESLDEQLLVDAGFSEMIDVIEDEIIEEYLEGMLNRDDRYAVESHFLRPPERQRKLQIARLLNSHFARELQTSKANSPETESTRNNSQYPRQFSYFGVRAGIATLVLLATSVAFLVQVSRKSNARIRELSQSVAREQQRSADLNHSLQSARQLAEPATVVLSLLQPERRGDTPLPEVKIGQGTANVHIEVALPSGNSGEYDVVLETTEKTLWSRDRTRPFTSPDGAILILDVPSQLLRQGQYRLVIRQKKQTELSYPFVVSQQ